MNGVESNVLFNGCGGFIGLFHWHGYRGERKLRSTVRIGER